ncbi:hypothetical protein BS78_02G012100 [Paspalum vaginatum]|nr:hypothetical protein BS78_02G012100 [Paspalum vaginatum]
MAQQSGGGIGGKRAKLPSSSAASIAAGEDRLSALPDDVLVVILLGLGTTTEAARTSVLSRRWRRVWALLPELRFPLAPDGRRIREALLAPGAPPLLRRIFVTAEGSAPDSLRAWLPDAARRLSGDLVYRNMPPREEVSESEDGGEEGGPVQLPCFENATGIDLNLGFLGLALPLAGTFTRLTELRLCRVGLHGPCELGDVVSSSRCPNLQKLSVGTARVTDKLTIRSESLLQVDLAFLHGLRQLSIVAPVLEELQLVRCLAGNQPVVNISTPQLVSLNWRDPYDPISVQLGNLGCLQRLCANIFLVYGQHDNGENRDFRRLMQRFPFIHGLKICLSYRMDTGIFPYLMEEITTLPRTASLTISIFNRGHAFGPSAFHVLRLCTGIRRLKLALCILRGLEVQILVTWGDCVYHDERGRRWGGAGRDEDLDIMCVDQAATVINQQTGRPRDSRWIASKM